MLQNRNDNLLINICQVQLKSAQGSSFPAFAPIYTSLSKIKWSSSPSITRDGILYRNKLTLSYPGLNRDQFQELDKFIRGLYQVTVETEEKEKYLLAGEENPMQVDLNFNGGETEINFAHTAIEPIQFIESEEPEDFGLAYYLTFNLA